MQLFFVILAIKIDQINFDLCDKIAQTMKRNSKYDEMIGRKVQQKTYLTRYRESNEISHHSKLGLRQKGESIWIQQQIQQRRQKIIDNLLKQSEASRIRIQEQSMQSQFLRDDYLDLQIMWLKKIDQIKEETHKLCTINSKQHKTIESLREEVQMKRQKLKELEGKVNDINRTSQDTLGDQEEQSDCTCKEKIKLIQQYQNQLTQLHKDRQEIIKENYELESNIQLIRTNISEMQPKVANIRQKQSAMKAKKDDLMAELRHIRSQNRELQKIIQRQFKIEEDTNVNIGEYIELAQNMLMAKQLLKLQQLMVAKQEQEEKKELFRQNNVFLKENSKDLDIINARVKQKERIIQKLTFDIKQKSIEQLNLYNY